MNELNNINWKPPMSEALLEQAYRCVLDTLERNEKGGIVNSLQNCAIALQYDPILGGHIRDNLFTERLILEEEMPWRRKGTAIDDDDLAFILLHL